MTVPIIMDAADHDTAPTMPEALPAHVGAIELHRQLRIERARVLAMSQLCDAYEAAAREQATPALMGCRMALRHVIEERNSLDAINSDMAAQLAAANYAIDWHAAHQEHAERERDSAWQTVERTFNQNAALQAENTHLCSMVNLLRGKNECEREVAEHVAAERDALRSLTEELKDDIANLRSQVIYERNQASAERDDLRQQCATAEQMAAHWKAEAERLERERDSADRQLGDTQAALRQHVAACGVLLEA